MELTDALIVLVWISLIIFIIALIVLCIKLIGTLTKVDYLLNNVTRKAESLDALFDIIENTTSKFGAISSTLTNYISSFFGKLFTRKRTNRKIKEKENMYE